MAGIDAEALLKEVAAETPSGENLEYDPDFGELERVARGKPEQTMGDETVPAEEPDWTDVQNRAVKLLSRTKDLRVALYLVRAGLNTGGLVGLSAGLKVLRGLLDRYWDTIHPQLDPEDDNDPTLRVNTIASLCDPESLLGTLREAPLVTSRGFGQFSYRHIAVANGDLAPAKTDAPAPDSAAINAAFTECELEQLQATTQATREALDDAATIEVLVTDRVGAANAPNLSELTQLLKAIDRILGEKLSQRGGSVSAPASDGEASLEGGAAGSGAGQATGDAAVALGGQIKSREDVLRVLDKICEYYDRHEPSSPIPLLMRRAKRLVAKGFMEILRDMAPDGVSQAEKIGGTDRSDD